MLTAKDLFENDYPHSHTLPKPEVIAFAERYHLYVTKREQFNSEQWIAAEKLRQERKRLKGGDK